MTAFIQNIIEQGGYLGIFLLMVLENIFPPIPSELIVPFAGYVAAQGKLSAVGVVVSATLGSVGGTFIWYLLARWFGEERLRRLVAHHGRWVTMNQHDVTRASKWFGRYGGWTICLGRLVPTLRTLISIPAGIACMSPRRFFLLTLAGSFLWVFMLTLLGLGLHQHYDHVEAWLSPASSVVVALIVIAYVWRVLRYRPGE